MLISGVTKYDVKRIMDSINKDFGTTLYGRDLVSWMVPFHNTHGMVLRRTHHCKLHLRLHDSADTFHRRSKEGRKKVNVCWHGTTLFLVRLFKQHPTAKVRTDVIRYADQEDFYSRFKQTVVGSSKTRNSTDDTRRYDERCDCVEVGGRQTMSQEQAAMLVREILVETQIREVQENG